jgi:hypothetical protein
VARDHDARRTGIRRYLNVGAASNQFAVDRFDCTDAYVVRTGPRTHWSLVDPDCSVEIDVEDFHQPFDPFPASSGTLAKDYASNHFEVSGRVTGRVVLEGRSYSVDGLGYRDHSWGLRNWATLLSHRWVVGSCGPDLSFGAISWHGVDSTLRKYGYVVRDGRFLPATEIDIVTFMEVDAMTHRGGEVTLALADGSTSRIRATPVAGIVTLHRNIATVDELCTVDLNGRPGYCDFEITDKPAQRLGTLVRTCAGDTPGRTGMVDLTAELTGPNVRGRRAPVSGSMYLLALARELTAQIEPRLPDSRDRHLLSLCRKVLVRMAYAESISLDADGTAPREIPPAVGANRVRIRDDIRRLDDLGLDVAAEIAEREGSLLDAAEAQVQGDLERLDGARSHGRRAESRPSGGA